MYLHNGDQPYLSSADAMTHWPETATAVGIRLGRDGEIEVEAPFGLDNLFNVIVRPRAPFEAAEKRHIYPERLASKNWPGT